MLPYLQKFVEVISIYSSLEIRVLNDLRQFAIEKDGDFCFDQNQSNGNIFKVKKSHISLIHGGGRQGRQIGNVGSQSSIV